MAQPQLPGLHNKYTVLNGCQSLTRLRNAVHGAAASEIPAMLLTEVRDAMLRLTCALVHNVLNLHGGVQMNDWVGVYGHLGHHGVKTERPNYERGLDGAPPRTPDHWCIAAFRTAGLQLQVPTGKL